ncbi:MAG: CBS domain-containing protein [Candidatus Bathyarchaeota archaeon]|nr:CBS domain-containing protein [Candidatus Bathyarchaeota archaeon]
MKVVDAMRKEIVIINEETSVAEASKSMREKGEGCAIILRKGTPVGIVTERDVTWKVAGNGLDPKRVQVSEIMSAPLVTIDPDASLIEAAKIMEEHKIRRLAVAKKGILYGVLTAIDIARNLEGYVESEVRNILRYAFFFH